MKPENQMVAEKREHFDLCWQRSLREKGGIWGRLMYCKYVLLNVDDWAASRSGKMKSAASVLRAVVNYLTVRASVGLVSKPPGTKLFRVAEFFFSPKTLEKTFKPILADWRFELYEALKENCYWKGRWINFKYRWLFLNSMGLSKIWELIDGQISRFKKS